VIDRRSMVAGILSLPFAVRVARAQPLRKSWRIGALNAGPKDAMAAFDKVLERAFGDIARSGADGICVFADAFTFGYRNVIADFAVTRRLPTSGYTREYAEAGALLSYGPNLLEVYRGAASYVDKILTTGSPATLPVQLPTKFELVINRGTARALGLPIPPSLLLRADLVIQ
jgi:putative ABC transport system substrate-binding protein